MNIFQSIREVFRNYFSEVDSPFNLALFRIVVFSLVLVDPETNTVEWFAALPRGLMQNPQGLGWLMRLIPWDPRLVHWALILFWVLSVLGLVGLFTRVSSLGAALCAVYVWALPQLYGKITHLHHHLVWFMLLMAMAPCAEVLSLDAVLKAFREADQGRLPPRERAVRFGRPLRFVWLLMGLCYFFPGFWKMTACPAWVFSNNLQYHLYQSWFQSGVGPPVFRIDHYPHLCELAALVTVLFELSFIFLILFPRTRLIAPLGGLVFHHMTAFFMGIFFRSLWISYLSFLDWDRFFAWLGRKLFPRPLTLLYDGQCKICRRTIFSIRQFDLFKRVDYVNAMDNPLKLPEGAPAIDKADLIRDMHAVVGNQKWLGYEAYRVLVPRIPFLWPLWPFLWLWPVPALGKIIYRKVADSRMCQLRADPISAPAAAPQAREKGLASLTCMGVFLVAVNAAMGFGDRIAMWPFACYPTFQNVVRQPEIGELLICGVTPRGKEEPIDIIGVMGGIVAKEKVRGLTITLLLPNYRGQMAQRAKILADLLRSHDPSLSRYKKMRFYGAVFSTDPRMVGSPPLSKEFLMEINNQETGANP